MGSLPLRISIIFFTLTALLFNNHVFAQDLSRRSLKEVSDQPSHRIIVKYKKGESPADLKEKSDRNSRSRLFGFLPNGQSEDSKKLSKLKEVQQEYIEESRQLLETTENESIELVTISEDKDVKKVLDEYEGLSNVESVQYDYKTYAFHTPNDLYFSQMVDTKYNESLQWGMVNTNIENAWDLSKGSNSDDVIIAVLDSGIDINHPDLSAKIITYYDCINDAGTCYQNTGLDEYVHGTHVSGIASAHTNNEEGVAGAGYNTKLVSMRVLDSTGTGYVSYFVSALNFLRENYSDKNIIVNMSLGHPFSSTDPYVSAEEDIINELYNSGEIIIAAAGNYSSIHKVYPAAFENVVSVGSLTRNDTKSSFSSYGNWVDLSAPGGEGDCGHVEDSTDYPLDCILSTTPTGNYNVLSGTSMAAPLVSGITALAWSVNPSIENTDIVRFIKETADPVSGTGTYWQYGKVNAYAAVLAAVNFNPKEKYDLNNEGGVNYSDFIIFNNYLFDSVIETDKSLDFNEDSFVNALDLFSLISNIR